MLVIKASKMAKNLFNCFKCIEYIKANIFSIVGKYMNRHKGAYLTREDEGAQDAFDADTAVLQGRTGHQVEKKKEWFI